MERGRTNEGMSREDRTEREGGIKGRREEMRWKKERRKREWVNHL